MKIFRCYEFYDKQLYKISHGYAICYLKTKMVRKTVPDIYMIYCFQIIPYMFKIDCVVHHLGECFIVLNTAACPGYLTEKSPY